MEQKFSEDKPKDCRYCYFWKGKRSILSELAKLLKISVTDGYKGMGFQQITQ